MTAFSREQLDQVHTDFSPPKPTLTDEGGRYAVIDETKTFAWAIEDDADNVSAIAETARSAQDEDMGIYIIAHPLLEEAIGQQVERWRHEYFDEEEARARLHEILEERTKSLRTRSRFCIGCAIAVVVLSIIACIVCASIVPLPFTAFFIWLCWYEYNLAENLRPSEELLESVNVTGSPENIGSSNADNANVNAEQPISSEGSPDSDVAPSTDAPSVEVPEFVRRSRELANRYIPNWYGANSRWIGNVVAQVQSAEPDDLGTFACSCDLLEYALEAYPGCFQS